MVATIEKTLKRMKKLSLVRETLTKLEVNEDDTEMASYLREIIGQLDKFTRYEFEELSQLRSEVVSNGNSNPEPKVSQ
jgi:two-component sensor histidine kinase